MDGNEELSDEQLVDAIDDDNAHACRAMRSLLSRLPEIERRELWRSDGAHDTAHWLGMRFGISYWKAERWIAAAHALPALPEVSQAFGRGDLGIDKVVELVRFATPSTEKGLIAWAQEVSCGAIRRRGDLLRRAPEAEAAEVDKSRTLEWWYLDEGRRFGLSAELPAAQGAVVASALERLAATVPEMPGEDDPVYASARRADALVALCSSRIADDADQDRATLVIHVQAGGPTAGARNCGRARASDRASRDKLRRPCRDRRRAADPPSWPDRPVELAAHLFVPPQAGPRIRLASEKERRRDRALVPSRRHEISSRTLAGQRTP